MTLPFTRSEFLGVFADYKAAVFPLQLVTAVLGLLAILPLFWRPVWADRAIAGVLCFFWSVMAIAYHWFY